MGISDIKHYFYALANFIKDFVYKLSKKLLSVLRFKKETLIKDERSNNNSTK